MSGRLTDMTTTTEVPASFSAAGAQDWIMQAKRLIHGLASQQLSDEMEEQLMAALVHLTNAFKLLDDGRG